MSPPNLYFITRGGLFFAVWHCSARERVRHATGLTRCAAKRSTALARSRRLTAMLIGNEQGVRRGCQNYVLRRFWDCPTGIGTLSNLVSDHPLPLRLYLWRAAQATHEPVETRFVLSRPPDERPWLAGVSTARSPGDLEAAGKLMPGAAARLDKIAATAAAPPEDQAAIMDVINCPVAQKAAQAHPDS